MPALDSAMEDQKRQLASAEDWMAVDGRPVQFRAVCTQVLHRVVKESVYILAEAPTKE
jgi:hypothetical protein